MRNIQDQTICIEGKTYTPQNLKQLLSLANESEREELTDLYYLLYDWWKEETAEMQLQTSGSTGTPKILYASKERMWASATMTCQALQLQEGDTALLCMNLKYIGAKMVVIRAIVAGLNLIVRPASSHPLKDVDTPITFAAMVPLQVYQSLQEYPQKIRAIEQLIIGGGAIDHPLEESLQSFPHQVYSTYGMTETLSHIALRKINGKDRSDFYLPLPGISISQSKDNTLIVEAPQLCEHRLFTNDIIELQEDKRFRILGRKDNIINSGSVKINPETIERELERYLSSPFVITSQKDNRLGEAIVLLVEGNEKREEEISSYFDKLSSPYFKPKHIYYVEHLPRTENGKLNRPQCRVYVASLLL